MEKHFISNKDESVPLFSSPYLHFLTTIPFYVPLLIYVPVILYNVYTSFFVYQVPVWYFVPLVVLGVAIWSFTEYNMHRFAFHWMPPGKLGAQANFLLHGVHHAYPRDSKRLVMVPVISIPLAFSFYFLFKLILGQAYVAPFFVGFVIGYLFYDMTHYALHHANFRSKFWLDLKQHHMIHHYTDPDNGFGVSSKFWDLVYRTTFKKRSGGPVVVEEHRKETIEI